MTGLWFVALGPFALALAGALPLRDDGSQAAPRRAAAIAAASLCALDALVAAGYAAAAGPAHTPTIGARGLGFALYLDALSATLFCLVAIIGLVVAVFARNYLRGDRAQARFLRFFCLTLASVLGAILAGNVLMLALAWIATSLSLQRLLLLYPERPAAQLAGRKKLAASRLGEACLIGAGILLYRSFGSLDYSRLLQGANPLHAATPAMQAASLLLVCAALLASAQLPAHGWLLEVMETPTPVSALLHAGIINAGGFLVLRFAPVLSLSTPSMHVLAIVGGLTALFGSIVLLPQTSIKVSLAYSTIAQMGFMLFECGLGAFAAAALHIVAHSCYKAHAFLSSGSVVDVFRASYVPKAEGKAHPIRSALTIAASLVLFTLVGRAFGATLAAQPGVFALGATAVLGIVLLIERGTDGRPSAYVILRTLALAALAAAAYFGLQHAADLLFAGAFPKPAARDVAAIVPAAAIVSAFAAVVMLQLTLPWSAGAPRWQAIYAHVANGFYLNTISNRIALRFGGSR
jgi:NAD(P)H-quinone oxidoreductase subunit 5